MTFKPIEEELEQYHFIVAVIDKGVTIITSQRLELKSLKHSETCILNGNGYILMLPRNTRFSENLKAYRHRFIVPD